MHVSIWTKMEPHEALQTHMYPDYASIIWRSADVRNEKQDVPKKVHFSGKKNKNEKVQISEKGLTQVDQAFRGFGRSWPYSGHSGCYGYHGLKVLENK